MSQHSVISGWSGGDPGGYAKSCFSFNSHPVALACSSSRAEVLLASFLLPVIILKSSLTKVLPLPCIFIFIQSFILALWTWVCMLFLALQFLTF